MAFYLDDFWSHVVYTVLLVGAAIFSTVAAAFADWVNRTRPDSEPTVQFFEAGPYRYCLENRISGQFDCNTWGGNGGDSQDIPGQFWQACAGLFAFAVALLIISVILTVVTFFKFRELHKLQTLFVFISAMVIFIAIFLFGAGLETTRSAQGEASLEYRISCGPGARRFDSDECSFGAGGALAVTAVVFNLLLAVMSFYIYPGGRGNAAVSPLMVDEEQ